jgi:hypothetical protein
MSLKRFIWWTWFSVSLYLIWNEYSIVPRKFKWIVILVSKLESKATCIKQPLWICPKGDLWNQVWLYRFKKKIKYLKWKLREKPRTLFLPISFCSYVSQISNKIQCNANIIQHTPPPPSIPGRQGKHQLWSIIISVLCTLLKAFKWQWRSYARNICKQGVTHTPQAQGIV